MEWVERSFAGWLYGNQVIESFSDGVIIMFIQWLLKKFVLSC